MIITNKFNLPEPIVEAVQSDYEYKDKRYSVTTLLKSIREIMLLRRYSNKCVVDVSDLIWSLFGTAVHSILEKSSHSDYLMKEQKIELKIGEYTLSGRYDLYNTREQSIIDYKVTSTYKVLKQEFEDYKLQGLIYAYILKSIGYTPKYAKFVLFLRDWQSTKSKFDKNYPKSQVYVKEFKFTEKDYDFIKDWLEKKFKEIEIAENTKDYDLPLCTEQERWSTDKAPDRKCQGYCQCCEFCDYYLKKHSNGGYGGLPF